MDRASVFGTEGWGFESLRPGQFFWKPSGSAFDSLLIYAFDLVCASKVSFSRLFFQ
jgi:hypothetical protein